MQKLQSPPPPKTPHLYHHHLTFLFRNSHFKVYLRVRLEGGAAGDDLFFFNLRFERVFKSVPTINLPYKSIIYFPFFSPDFSPLFLSPNSDLAGYLILNPLLLPRLPWDFSPFFSPSNSPGILFVCLFVCLFVFVLGWALLNLDTVLPPFRCHDEPSCTSCTSSSSS